MRILLTTLGAALASALLGAAPATTAPAHHAATGRYRLVVTGFTVNHETWDNAFETDGKRDEVFVDVSVSLLDRANGAISSLGSKRTRVIGDVNFQSGRLKGGSASALGGLRTGDSYPTAQPWTIAGAMTTDGLPLEVWRGDLAQGGSGVTVLPSIWEYDGGGLDFVTPWYNFAKQFPLYGAPLVSLVNSSLGQNTIKAAQVGYQFANRDMDSWAGHAADRPIGIDYVSTSGGTIPGWKDTPVVSLTYESAESLLASNPTGRGLGVASVHYVDNSKYAGDYTLYLKLERVP